VPTLPNRIQGSPFGTVNTASGSNQFAVAPAILQPGPSQPREQFSARPGIPPEVARALNDLQTNIQQAVSRAKADPKSNKNLFEQVPLVQGGAAGAAPYLVVSHGLGSAYRGFCLQSPRNGYVTAHSAITNNVQYPPAQFLCLWVTFTAFGSTAPTVDLEIWA
jgi:hypothetical protein